MSCSLFSDERPWPLPAPLGSGADYSDPVSTKTTSGALALITLCSTPALREAGPVRRPAARGGRPRGFQQQRAVGQRYHHIVVSVAVAPGFRAGGEAPFGHDHLGVVHLHGGYGLRAAAHQAMPLRRFCRPRRTGGPALPAWRVEGHQGTPPKRTETLLPELHAGPNVRTVGRVARRSGSRRPGRSCGCR